MPDERTQHEAFAQKLPCHRRTDKASGTGNKRDAISHDRGLLHGWLAEDDSSTGGSLKKPIAT